MRVSALAALLLIAICTPAPGQQAQAPPPADPPAKTAATTASAAAPVESPLVRAAREAKARRKRSTRKVLTNADVRKSKGKLTVNTLPPLPAGVVEVRPRADDKAAIEKQDDQLRARLKASERVSAAENLVGEFEKALKRVEQAYDLNHRDDDARKRLAEAQQQLADARRLLADARDSLLVLSQPKQ